MNKIIVSEAFDALHECSNNSEKKRIIKENTSINTPVVAKRNLNKRLLENYENFDEFYEGVWQRLYDLGGEVIDSAIEGNMGTTWVKWSPNSSVYSIDEDTALDIAEEVFETTKDMDEVIEKFVNASFPSDKFDKDDDR